MATLYQLNHQLSLLQLMLEEGHDVSDTIESIEMAIEDKLEGYAMVIRNLESDIDGLKNEEKRLSERRKSLENGVQRMKEAIADTLSTSGKDKVKTAKFSIGWRKSTAVEIVDESLIPDEFVKITRTISRSELSKRLKEEAIPGASLVENKSISIR